MCSDAVEIYGLERYSLFKEYSEINSINVSGNIGLFLCNPTYIMEHLLHFHPVRGF